MWMASAIRQSPAHAARQRPMGEGSNLVLKAKVSCASQLHHSHGPVSRSRYYDATVPAPTV